VAASLGKELQYFSLNYHRGEGWYRSHFPIGGRAQTFEATPYYLFHPHAARRAAETVPSARVVALVRDPVTRAFSHWRHNVARGLEPLAFDAAIDAEEGRLAEDSARLKVDPGFQSRNHRLYSYVARGRYAEQLAHWFDLFGPERVLVVRSEDLYASPGETHGRVLWFLGLPEHRLAVYPVHTRSAPGVTVPPETRGRLCDLFAPHNARLAEMVGVDMAWDLQAPRG